MFMFYETPIDNFVIGPNTKCIYIENKNPRLSKCTQSIKGMTSEAIN